MQPINILITVDSQYAPHVRTVLKSLFVNNPDEVFHIYIIHADVGRQSMADLENFCRWHHSRLFSIRIHDDSFSEAPITAYYSKAMYYRLLAYLILPRGVTKILYLDPDTLIINSIRKLYDINLEGNLYAAASHTGLTNLIKYVNRIRLRTYNSLAYFNSGVLLLNVERQRKEVDKEEILAYLREHKRDLILPDQDLLNVLFCHKILQLDDSIYNYDPRRFETYFLASGGEKNLDWVMANTVIVHFCGKAKPWMKCSRRPFTALYRHYMQQARSIPVTQAMPRFEREMTGRREAVDWATNYN